MDDIPTELPMPAAQVVNMVGIKQSGFGRRKTRKSKSRRSKKTRRR